MLFTSKLIVILAYIRNLESYETRFSPQYIKARDFSKYENLPLRMNEMRDDQKRLRYEWTHRAFDVGKQLMHRASPSGPDAIIGLAVYKNNMRAFKALVGSLRYVGYDGHIILGVSPDLTSRERQYLQRMNVTFYSVEISGCEGSVRDGNAGKTNWLVRGSCSTDILDLTLEWSRYEMARRWLLDCPQCMGWTMVCDTRDVLFQAHPFLQLGNPNSATKKVLLIEEISPYSSPVTDVRRSFLAGNRRSRDHVVDCYGKASFDYDDRPVLCSGTVIGTKEGIQHFLVELVSEFYENNSKENPKCKSPHTTDQWTMNWMYYNGKFGRNDEISTIPWGVGPVLTIGKPCMTAERKNGAEDLIPRNSDGFMTNLYEDGVVSPVVHQFDRCFPWIGNFILQHSKIYHNPQD